MAAGERKIRHVPFPGFGLQENTFWAVKALFHPCSFSLAPRARSKTAFMLEGQVVKLDVKTLKVYYLPQLPLFCEGVKRDFFSAPLSRVEKTVSEKKIHSIFERDTFAPFLPTMRAKKHHFHRTKDLVNSIFDKYFLPASLESNFGGRKKNAPTVSDLC